MQFPVNDLRPARAMPSSAPAASPSANPSSKVGAVGSQHLGMAQARHHELEERMCEGDASQPLRILLRIGLADGLLRCSQTDPGHRIDAPCGQHIARRRY